MSSHLYVFPILFHNCSSWNVFSKPDRNYFFGRSSYCLGCATPKVCWHYVAAWCFILWPLICGTTILQFFFPLQSQKSIATYSKKLWGVKIQWNEIMPWGTTLLNQSLINTIRSSVWKQKCYLPTLVQLYFSNSSHSSGLTDGIVQISLAEATAVPVHSLYDSGISEVTPM